MEGRTTRNSRVTPDRPPAAMGSGGGATGSISDVSNDIFVFEVFGRRVSATVTRRQKSVRRWIHQVLHIHRNCYRRGDLVAGLGVQWRSDPWNAGREPVATIQICVDRRCLVFQISRAGKAPRALERFLADPSVTFVNVGIAAFQRRLQEHWELSVIRAVDLRWRASIGRASLQQMASNFLGWDTRLEDLKPPGVGLSDWEAESLDEGQIRYACLHAYTSFLLEKRFRELCGSS